MRIPGRFFASLGKAGQNDFAGRSLLADDLFLVN